MYNSYMEISFIIPVYNAEKYLARCLDSVLAALDGYKGEIILVDNKSTDGSLKIMRKYQHNWQKVIRIIKCNTKGASAARNKGVEAAHGKYIWFIDADDYIANHVAIIKLSTKAYGTKADLIMIGANRTLPDGKTSYLSAVDEKSSDYKSRFIRYGMGPWQVAIRREWWQKHGFKFKEGIIHEDMELMSSLILYTDNYASIDQALYHYCNNSESVLHKRKFSPHIFDIFPALEGLYQRFEKAGAENTYRAELEWFFIWNLLIDSAKDFAKFPEGKPGFKRSREMLKKYFPNWRQNKFLAQKPLKLRLRVLYNYYR